jgi:acetyl-CoA C-acetyltransferase
VQVHFAYLYKFTEFKIRNLFHCNEFSIIIYILTSLFSSSLMQRCKMNLWENYSMNKAVYITHAKRTAVGSLLGNFSDLSAPYLGSVVIKSIIESSKLDPLNIGEIIMGQVLTGGSGQNPARQAAMKASIPQEVPAFTINKVCGSGLKSVCLAANAIIAGEAEVMIVGGQENMSLGIHGVYARAGHKLGNMNLLDLMQYDGLTDIFTGKLMGVTAENIAARFNITRKEQDEFAYYSHQKAANAQKLGYFDDEIIPIEVLSKKQTVRVTQDQSIRPEATIELLNKLRSVFIDEGTVTAGNSSSINDGAAALMLVSEEALHRYGLVPLARIVSYSSAGVDPEIMGTGPVPASKSALVKAGWKVQDLDLIECNEAFAAQAIYVNRQMDWDANKVNVNGGAIAIGHPIGASGARVLVTLVHAMKRLSAKKSLATLCIGGGMGIAICIENV